MRRELIVVMLVSGVVMLVAYNKLDSSLLPFSSVRGLARVETPVPDATATDSHPKQAGTAGGGGKRRQSSALALTAPPMIDEDDLPVLSTSRREPVCCQNAEAPFPTPEMLKVGVTSMQIRKEFGAPALRVVGTKDGRVTEKYIYANHDRTLLTMAVIEDGHLVSAQRISSSFQIAQGLAVQ